ncbi:hypothetical protein KBD08_01475 [Candidatus Babeliales bacterium]|nr:hypothetical protein [Candidatus Babeliales bacterium]
MSRKKMLLVCTILGLSQVVCTQEEIVKKSVLASFRHNVTTLFTRVKASIHYHTRPVEPVVFNPYITDSVMEQYLVIMDEFLQRDVNPKNSKVREVVKLWRDFLPGYYHAVFVNELWIIIPPEIAEESISIIEAFVKNDTRRENKDIRQVLQYILGLLYPHRRR